MIFFILWVLLIVLCAALGGSKGYSVGLCILAGALGSVIALIVLLLLPDQNEQQAELYKRDQEIDALRQRIAQLEQTQKPQIAPESAPSPEQAPPPPPPPPGEPAHFPTRTREIVACPGCGKRQQGNRNLCYSCKLPFVYDDEAPAP